MHVDAAYGGAALLAPSVRDRFAGIEHADSLVIDPHKWLYAPFDCAALLYRDPALARAVHTQDASYLDVIHDEPDEWNPSDYAYQLTRRARGLPLWFSLAVHGSDAYRDAIERVLATAHAAAARIRALPHLELVREPELSIVLFRRTGWTGADYDAWSARLLDEQIAFVDPVAAGTASPSPASRSSTPRPRSRSSTRSSRPPRDADDVTGSARAPQPAARLRARRAPRASIARACAPFGGITRKRA